MAVGTNATLPLESDHGFLSWKTLDQKIKNTGELVLFTGVVSVILSSDLMNVHSENNRKYILKVKYSKKNV